MKNLFILVMLSLLSACDTNHDKDLPPGTIKNIGIYKPEVNKHRQYWTTIKGFIDPKLENKVPLRIFAIYESNSAACQYVINPLSGIYVNRMEMLKTTIKPDIAGEFTYKIPMDMFTPGYCKWKISYIGFLNNTHFPGYATDVLAYLNQPENIEGKHKSAVFNFYCLIADPKENPEPCGETSYTDRAQLHINKSNTIILNFWKKNDTHH